MKQFSPESVKLDSTCSLEALQQSKVIPERHSLYVGLDVHKDTIAIAVAYPGRSEPVFKGEVANLPGAIGKLIIRLCKEVDGGLLLVCYEAGPCGYDLYRQVVELGHDSPPAG